MVMETEDEFQISIDDRDAEKVVTVGQLYDVVIAALARRAPGGQVDREDVWRRLVQVVAKQAGVHEREILPSTSFVDDLRMD